MYLLFNRVPHTLKEVQKVPKKTPRWIDGGCGKDGGLKNPYINALGHVGVHIFIYTSLYIYQAFFMMKTSTSWCIGESFVEEVC